MKKFLFATQTFTAFFFLILMSHQFQEIHDIITHDAQLSNCCINIEQPVNSFCMRLGVFLFFFDGFPVLPNLGRLINFLTITFLSDLDNIIINFDATRILIVNGHEYFPKEDVLFKRTFTVTFQSCF